MPVRLGWLNEALLTILYGVVWSQACAGAWPCHELPCKLLHMLQPLLLFVLMVVVLLLLLLLKASSVFAAAPAASVESS